MHFSKMPVLAMLFSLSLLALPLSSAAAQERDDTMRTTMAPLAFQPHHAVTFSVLGAFGFARVNVSPFILGYEWIIDDHWGVLVEAHYMHFHGDPLHLNLFGGGMGIRYHFFGLRSSPFVGVIGGYRYGVGRTHGAADHHDDPHQLDVRAEQPFVAAHVGYRWVWGSGLNIGIRFGAGWGEYRVHSPNGETAASNDTLREVRDALGYSSVAIDSELSVGYSF